MELKRESVAGLFNDFFTYGLGNFLASGISILLTPVLTRIFTPHEYGIIDVLQTTIGIIAMLATLHMDSAILRYYNDTDKKGDLLSTHVFSIAFISLIIVLPGIIFRSQINSVLFKGEPWTAGMLPYVFLTLPATLLIRHVLIVFRTLRNSRYVIIISLLVAIIYFLLTVIFVAFLHSGIKGVFLAKFITEGAISVSVILIFRKYYSNIFSFGLLRKILKYSLPLVPERIANICLMKINRYFLVAYATVTDIGRFNIAQKVPAIMALIAAGFEQAWFPYAFSIMHRKYAQEIYRHIFTTYMKVMLLLTIITMIFAEEIILILATKEYINVSSLIGIVGGDIVMFGAAQILVIGLLIEKKMLWYLAATSISALANVCSCYILIPRYGIMGAASALYLANFIICVATYYYAEKYYPVNYRLSFLAAYFILVPVIGYLNNRYLADSGLYYKITASLGILALSSLFLKKEIDFIKSIMRERF